MGLDIYAGEHHFQANYGGFAEMRRQLAKMEHLDLDQMAGFGGDREWTDDFETPSLTPLLNHSDCEGFLGAHSCERVAARLRELSDAIAQHPAPWLAPQVGSLLKVLDFAADNRVALEYR